ncbi:MAG: Fe-S-cluster-containing hydrogenase [Planctomycetota bacterium]
MIDRTLEPDSLSPEATPESPESPESPEAAPAALVSPSEGAPVPVSDAMGAAPSSDADTTAGRRYWRSILHQADPERFEKKVDDEFSGYDPDGLLTMPRRQFLRFAAASLALAGVTLSGCRRWPREVMAPYANRPEGHIPGTIEQYASMLPFAGFAMPCVVEAFDGRPIKIEGNARHPWALGTTNQFLQAATLELYDPDRLVPVLHQGELAHDGASHADDAHADAHGGGHGGHGDDDTPSPTQARLAGAGWSAPAGGWKAFDHWAHDHFESLRGPASRGLYVLAEPMPGPTAERLKARLKERYPQMTWAEWAPFNRDAERAGLADAFGAPMRPVYQLAEAKVIATFDADPLAGQPDSPRLAKDWAEGRRRADSRRVDGDDVMSRTYAVEPSLTLTGAKADHRLAKPASQIGPLVAAVAAGVGVPGADFQATGEDNDKAAKFIQALVDDLKKAGPSGVVIAGPNQPAEVHALCGAINATLGAVGTTVAYLPDGDADTPGLGDQLQSLAEDLNAGRVETLVLLGGNPAFDAPAELDLPSLLGKAGHVLRMSAYFDETARLSGWRLPMAHPLECWGDGYAYDGTATLQQPLILPLGQGRSPIELLAQLADGKPADGLDLVKQTHKRSGLPGNAGFEKDWRTALHEGFVQGSSPELATPALRSGYRPPSPGLPVDTDLAQGRFEASFRPGPLYDGRYANNGWLQEVPDPLTKVSWANPVLLAPSDAQAMGVSYGDFVTVQVGSRPVTAPAYVIPGQAPGTVILRPGHGRRAAGRVGGDDNAFAGGEGVTVGVDLYPLRTRDGLGFVEAQVSKAGGSMELPLTADHHLLDKEAVADWAVKKRVGKQGESGKILKEAALADYARDTSFVTGGLHGDVTLQLYEPPLKEKWEANAKAMRAAGHPNPPDAFNEPHAWGMTIDLTTCIGCNACVIACQAENNIPVVGERGVKMSREMHWLRIDTYYKPAVDKESGKPDWDDAHVDVAHMPVMCVHCENAPCEQVCPVAATVHDTEGLNTMVYNRCIGTRYCSNNCPYKVRRFNYFDWHSKPVHAGWAKPWLDFPDTQIGSEIGPVERMAMNPDVTVRMRGVMEKCTYCVQRISRAKIQAKNEWAQTQHGSRTGEGRDQPTVRDGEAQTACQTSCPTGAIVFGNLNDPTSKVFRSQQDNPRAYSLLAELNSRPRTKHLALIRNPSPKLSKDKPEAAGH